ncbi:MAG: hypothetical protein AB7F43_11485 [Bacteriovoracia bacterium]
MKHFYLLYIFSFFILNSSSLLAVVFSAEDYGRTIFDETACKNNLVQLSTADFLSKTLPQPNYRAKRVSELAVRRLLENGISKYYPWSKPTTSEEQLDSLFSKSLRRFFGINEVTPGLEFIRPSYYLVEDIESSAPQNIHLSPVTLVSEVLFQTLVTHDDQKAAIGATIWLNRAKVLALKTNHQDCINVKLLRDVHGQSTPIDFEAILDDFVTAFFLRKDPKLSEIENVGLADPLNPIEPDILFAGTTPQKAPEQIRFEAVAEVLKKAHSVRHLMNYPQNLVVAEITKKIMTFELFFPERKGLFWKLVDEYVSNGTIPNQKEIVEALLRQTGAYRWQMLSPRAKMEILRVARIALTRIDAQPEEILDAADFMYGLKRLGYCIYCAKEAFKLVTKGGFDSLPITPKTNEDYGQKPQPPETVEFESKPLVWWENAFEEKGYQLSNKARLLLERLHRHAVRPTRANKCFVIQGEHGSGKSAFVRTLFSVLPQMKPIQEALIPFLYYKDQTDLEKIRQEMAKVNMPIVAVDEFTRIEHSKMNELVSLLQFSGKFHSVILLDNSIPPPGLGGPNQTPEQRLIDLFRLAYDIHFITFD